MSVMAFHQRILPCPTVHPFLPFGWHEPRIQSDLQQSGPFNIVCRTDKNFITSGTSPTFMCTAPKLNAGKSWKRIEAPRRFPFDQSKFPGARAAVGRTKPNQRAECGERAPTAVKAIGLTATAAAGIWPIATCTPREGGREGGRVKLATARKLGLKILQEEVNNSRRSTYDV